MVGPGEPDDHDALHGGAAKRGGGQSLAASMSIPSHGGTATTACFAHQHGTHNGVCAASIRLGVPHDANAVDEKPITVGVSVVKQICPTCGEKFDTVEEARHHWLESHRQNEAPQIEMETIVRKICPTCGEAFSTEEEGRKHWLEKHGPAATQESANNVGEPDGLQGVVVGVAKCKLIAADDDGNPIIVRHEEECQSRTIVMNKDGTQRIFGESTITSMSLRDEVDVEQWIVAMTTLQLRGLVHEFGQRVVEYSSKYHETREKVERLTVNIGRHIFNLQEGASEKDLDVAYRRLAREMHPDKNGGTEEAKERFQAMNHRYKDMKAKLTSSGAGSSTAAAASQQPDRDEIAKEIEPKVQAGDEHDQEHEQIRQQRQQRHQPEFVDALTADREALEKEAWKMLRQMKAIVQNMKMIDSEYEQLRAEACAAELPRDCAVGVTADPDAAADAPETEMDAVASAGTC